MQTIVEIENGDVHSYIDCLIAQKMYGEVTFFMQAGNIEGCRESRRHTRKEIKAMVGNGKVLTPVKRSSPNGKM